MRHTADIQPVSSPMTTIDPALLPRIEIFKNLTARDAEQLMPACEELKAVAGQVVFDAGVVGRALYVVLDGTVEIDLEPARAAERIIAVLEAGSVFGESSFFHAQPHSGTVKARTDVRLLRLNREPLDRLLASGSPAALRVAANAAEILAERLQQADKIIVALLDQIQDEKVHTAIREFRRSLLHSSGQSVPPGMPGGS
jgi:CRP-like cAMP-binding protein